MVVFMHDWLLEELTLIEHAQREEEDNNHTLSSKS